MTLLLAATAAAAAAAERPGCNDAARHGSLRLACRFIGAYRCLGVSPYDLSFVNWRLQRWGYGCYTSERNLGLDVKPVDAVDQCGRDHDIDWHAICQNHPERDQDRGDDHAVGCDCYGHTPKLECDDASEPPRLVLPELTGESAACERLCGKSS